MHGDVHTQRHIRAHLHTHMPTHMPTHAHQQHTHLLAPLQKRVCTHTHAQAHMEMHLFTHTLAGTHSHTCISDEHTNASRQAQIRPQAQADAYAQEEAQPLPTLSEPGLHRPPLCLCAPDNFRQVLESPALRR